MEPDHSSNIAEFVKEYPEIKIVSFYINVPRRDRLIKILQRGDNIEEAYRRSLSDVGQFDGIEDEVDFVIENNGYEREVMDVAWEIKSNIDWIRNVTYEVI